MRNYIILNGKNSNQINGLLIQELPPISKPLLRNQIEEIDGRDGDIVTPLGYSAYDKEFTIGLYKDFDVNEVAAYFNSEGTVIFSNEPDKYYYYQITAQIDFERLVRYRTATVTMHCQPFKYSATEQPITEDVSGTVSDEGTNFALENTAEASFNTLDLKGNTEQDTLSGKNLVDINFTDSTSDGVTKTLNADGSITLNGHTTKGHTFVIAPAVDYEIGQTYTIHIEVLSGSFVPYNSNKNWAVTFIYTKEGSSKLQVNIEENGGTVRYTPTSSIVSQSVQLWFGFDSNTTSELAIFNNFTFRVQIEKGSTATSYEKFVGGTPSPNPDYPQPIQTVTGLQTVEIQGKNLFDKDNPNIANYYIEQNNVITANNTNRLVWIPCLPNTTYTIQAVADGLNRTIGYTETAPVVGVSVLGRTQIAQGGTTATITTGANARYLVYQLWHSSISTKTLSETMGSVQIELGSTSTSYAPYSKQTYEINLGKNLFNKNDVEVGTVMVDGSFDSTYNDARTSGYVPVLPNTTYVTRGRPNGWKIQAFYTKDKTFIQRTSTAKFTTPDNCYFVRLECNMLDLDTCQVEAGSTATTYAPYFEPIELCKIGDYQDYIWKDGEDWKVHKDINHIVFTGNESWVKHSATDGDIFMLTVIPTAVGYGYGTGRTAPALMEHFEARPLATPNSEEKFGISHESQLRCFTGTVGQMTVEQFKSFIADESLYYALATPTDTVITDQTLIEQLDDIYYHAHAYKCRTYIRSSAATVNMPLVISAEVVEDNESTITNAGNYLSKPRITVYGSGDISLYINDMHVLQITLGDEGYITIDTAQMEAYKDTLDNLKNRLVIGDYSNARLKPGANKIHFTGKVTKYVVEDYSRWL